MCHCRPTGLSYSLVFICEFKRLGLDDSRPGEASVLLVVPWAWEEFVAMARELIVQWYGEDPQASPDLCRVVNSRHFSRLMNLLNTTKVFPAMYLLDFSTLTINCPTEPLTTGRCCSWGSELFQ